jgi:hypothetical protein
MDRASPVARGYLIEEGVVSEIPLTVIEEQEDHIIPH